MGYIASEGAGPHGGKQKYTRELSESAVKLVIDQGRRPDEAAAKLGMPVNTLMAWVSRACRNLSGGGRAFTPPTEAQMQARGVTRSRNTIARVMHKHGIRSKVKRKFRVRTTDSKHDYPIAANLLDRNFQVEALDTVWLCDITYIPTGEGWLYLAGVMDLCSRKIVGWSMAEHMRAGLVIDALEMARARRSPAPGQLHHSDRGVQYCCDEYRRLLDQLGAVREHEPPRRVPRQRPQGELLVHAQERAGPPPELRHRRRGTGRDLRLHRGLLQPSRLHSSLGYISPEAFEARRR